MSSVQSLGLRDILASQPELMLPCAVVTMDSSRASELGGSKLAIPPTVVEAEL